MAGPRTRRSPRRNPPPGGEDELAEGPPGASTKGSHTPTHSPTISRALTLAPLSTNKLFKRFMKGYLESHQGPSQPLKEHKRPLKAKMPDVYYGKSHMDCYHFCQQCEDQFETFRPPESTKPPLQLLFFVGTSAYNRRSLSVIEVGKLPHNLDKVQGLPTKELGRI